MCVRVRARARACVCVRACACASVRALKLSQKRGALTQVALNNSRIPETPV